MDRCRRQGGVSLPEEWVWLARIRRTQGRKGEVFADILTDFPGKFAERRRLWLLDENERLQAGGPVPPREVSLAAHWLHKGGIVLSFEGVHSISDAQALSGLVVAIPRGERAALGDDEAYVSDLSGCELLDVASGTPVRVGKIENVDRTSGPVALLVVGGGSGEILIPFARSYLRRLDLGNKQVEMALPEGLVHLNDADSKGL
ncbi:MAG TPA: ribosome maturation factor RimM [Terriglobia bacterium]|nr:ribosome maturation factor RimM [Terriglobia bacterium]